MSTAALYHDAGLNLMSLLVYVFIFSSLALLLKQVCFSTVTRKTRSRRAVSDRSRGESEEKHRDASSERGSLNHARQKPLSPSSQPPSLFYRRSRRDLNYPGTPQHHAASEPKFRVIDLAEPQEALKAAVKFGGSSLLDASVIASPRVEVSRWERERPSSAAHPAQTPKRLSSTPRISSLRDSLSPRRAALPLFSLSPRADEGGGDVRSNQTGDVHELEAARRGSARINHNARPPNIQTTANNARQFLSDSVLNSPPVVRSSAGLHFTFIHALLRSTTRRTSRPGLAVSFVLRFPFIHSLAEMELLKRRARGLTPDPSGLTPLRKRRFRSCCCPLLGFTLWTGQSLLT